MRLSITSVTIMKPTLCLFLYSFYQKSSLISSMQKKYELLTNYAFIKNLI